MSAAAVDYLMFSGYVTMAYFWAQMAQKALERLDANDGAESPSFYQAKVQTAEFYFDRLLPRAKAHAESALAPSRSVMQLSPEHFSFA